MSASDLLAGRLLTTQAWLDFEGQDIVLTRPGTMHSDGAGGQRRDETPIGPLAAQRVVVIGKAAIRSIPGHEQEYTDDQGRRFRSPFTVVGMPDLDIKEGDTFMLYGLKHTIIGLHPDQRTEVKAESVSYSGG